MKYLFNHLKRYKDKFKNSPLLLCLDYDGTLTPIVKTPEQAILSGNTKNLLRTLSKKKRLKIAVISGRSLKNLRKKVGLKNIIYAGNHGLEIDFPGVSFSEPVNRFHLLAIKRVYNTLKQKLTPYEGIIIENKRATLSVHFRLANAEGVRTAKKNVKLLTKPFTAKKILKINSGKKVIEIKPDIAWDKGKTVLWLIKKYSSMSGTTNINVIYIGDDVTDNDAFKAIVNKGLTVFVGGNSRKFAARYYLKDVKEVNILLKQIKTYFDQTL